MKKLYKILENKFLGETVKFEMIVSGDILNTSYGILDVLEDNSISIGTDSVFDIKHIKKIKLETILKIYYINDIVFEISLMN